MSLGARVAALDDAVPPRRRTYDVQQPLWVAFAGPLTVVLHLVIVIPVVRGTDGLIRATVVAGAVVGCSGMVLAVHRWERAHRRPLH